MGFFDKLGGFVEKWANATEQDLDRKANSKNASVNDVTRAMDWHSRENQKRCKKCGGNTTSNTGYCYQCRKELGML
ncbi:MAG: hypothetical protein NC340_00935 [Ruminococcus flavefaciens]|nr:hypothetical protein [Ruminococcus flavefaciens]MCM1228713.1 hypothetical protein [Ruminococcus flavefaciens]